MKEWRTIIFSNEASIIVSTKRGQQNISRTVEEKYYPDCIERQYNNYSEAMFWGSFTYDHKGPCHIYYLETEAEKEEYLRIIQQINDDEIKAECREAFERQERMKEIKWVEEGRRPPARRAT